MKNILFIITLLFCFFANAQDKAIISKMVESKSIEDVRNISDNIIKGFESKLKYYKTVQSGKLSDEQYQLVVYVPTSINPSADKLTAEEREKALVINFGQFNKGENTDLGTKGETVYFFRNVSGSYLDLIDFWITTFYPSSTKEQVLEDYKLQEYRVNKDLKYKLKKEGDIWKMSKSY